MTGRPEEAPSGGQGSAHRGGKIVEAAALERINAHFRDRPRRAPRFKDPCADRAFRPPLRRHRILELLDQHVGAEGDGLSRLAFSAPGRNSHERLLRGGLARGKGVPPIAALSALEAAF